MTDKFTMEEKVKRLQELSPWKQDYICLDWLEDVANYNCTKHQYLHDKTDLTDTPERRVHAELTWDVHSGAAFTPLYKLL